MSHQKCSYQFVVFAPSDVRVTQPKSRELWLTVTFFHLGEFLFCFVSNFSILIMFHGAKEKTKLLLHVTLAALNNTDSLGSSGKVNYLM